jgi:hypothetical protein
VKARNRAIGEHQIVAGVGAESDHVAFEHDLLLHVFTGFTFHGQLESRDGDGARELLHGSEVDVGQSRAVAAFLRHGWAKVSRSATFHALLVGLAAHRFAASKHHPCCCFPSYAAGPASQYK